MEMLVFSFVLIVIGAWYSMKFSSSSTPRYPSSVLIQAQNALGSWQTVMRCGSSPIEILAAMKAARKRPLHNGRIRAVDGNTGAILDIYD